MRTMTSCRSSPTLNDGDSCSQLNRRANQETSLTPNPEGFLLGESCDETSIWEAIDSMWESSSQGIPEAHATPIREAQSGTRSQQDADAAMEICSALCHNTGHHELPVAGCSSYLDYHSHLEGTHIIVNLYMTVDDSTLEVTDNLKSGPDEQGEESHSAMAAEAQESQLSQCQYSFITEL